MARQFIYHMAGLNKAYGTKKVLENIHLSFYPDAKIGILGPNGSGKSTVLKIMAGMDKEYTGEAWLAEGATVGYLAQEPQLDPAKTVFENIMEGVARKTAIIDRYNELMMDYSDETADESAKLQDDMDRLNLWDLEQQVEMAMEALGCPPKDAEVTKLSGGERRRVALCQLLLRAPDLLLLDEPTNHLDAETTAWLEKHLRQYPGAVMIITHDRYFLDNVTGWILELDRGRGIPYEGNYTAYLEAKAKRMRQEGREDDARSKALTREREWIASSPKARQAKSKARIKAYDDLVAAANNRRPTDTQIVIPHGERLGQVVIEAEGLEKGYGDRLLIDDLEFKLPPGGIVGVIGPNGAGKTTLFRMITGQEKPDGGSIRIGETVKLGYVDQSRDTLDPQQDRVGRDFGRRRSRQARQARGQHPRLLLVVQFPRRRPAAEGRQSVGRPAQPRASGQDAEERRQRAAARRADQRPRHRDAGRARRRAGKLRRLRRDHQPRPHVPRPAGDPHPGLRGRQPCRMVRGQFRGLRARTRSAARAGKRQPAPHDVQAADAVGRQFASGSSRSMIRL